MGQTSLELLRGVGGGDPTLPGVHGAVQRQPVSPLLAFQVTKAWEIHVCLEMHSLMGLCITDEYFTFHVYMKWIIDIKLLEMSLYLNMKCSVFICCV